VGPQLLDIGSNSYSSSVTEILNPPAVLYHIDYTLVGLPDLVAVVTVLEVLREQADRMLAVVNRV